MAILGAISALATVVECAEGVDSTASNLVPAVPLMTQVNVAGTVVNEKDRPLENVDVELWFVDTTTFPYHATQEKVTRTDSSGRFAFPETWLPRDDERYRMVVARTDAVALQRGLWVTVPTSIPDFHPTSLKITIPEFTEEFTGTIEGPDGEPLPNLRVCQMVAMPAAVGIAEYVTDDKGEFRIPLPPGTITGKRGNSRAIFRAVHPELGTLQLAIDLALGEDTFYYQAPATVVGQVVDGSTMSPLEGIQLMTQPNAEGTTQESIRANTGNEGQVVTDAEGKFRLILTAEGLENIQLNDPLGRFVAPAVEKLRVFPGASVSVGVIYMSPGAIIQGQLVDEDTNMPLALNADQIFRIGVYGPARPRSSAAIHGAFVNPDGTFRLRLAAGVNQVYLSGGDEVSSRFDGQGGFLELNLTEGETHELKFPVKMKSKPAAK